MPVDTGYRVYVYYRATTRRPLGHLRHEPGHGRRDRRRLQRDQRHRPHGHHAARPRATPCRSPGRPTPPSPAASSASGWSAPANGWYVGKIVAADGTASYADSVDLERARRHRLPRLRLLPRHHRRPLGHLRHAPGHGRRDRRAFTAISVTAPTGTTSQAQGDALPVSWTTNAGVASGEFSIWVVSPGERLVRGQDRRRRRHGELRRQRRPQRARRHRLPRLRLLPRHHAATPGASTACAAGTVDVTAAGFTAISVTAPTGTTSKAQGDALPVTWTTNAGGRQRPVQHLGGQPRQRLVRGQDRRRRRHRRATPTASTSTCRSTPATASTSTTAPRRRPLGHLRLLLGHGQRDGALTGARRSRHGGLRKKESAVAETIALPRRRWYGFRAGNIS